MQILETIDETREILDRTRAAGGTVGLVATMGFLHDGHASLMRASVADNDITLVTNFVNPTQFAPDEDLSAYPRDIERDTAVCEAAGADLMLVPSVDEMYPIWPILTSITVDELSRGMEGAERRSHFTGVATVVAKLFNIGGRCRAYFGEKDYQQLALVRRLAIDLSFPVEVVGCPIVREANGLAMSSRNVYLSVQEREAAGILQAALQAGKAAIEAGERDPEAVRQTITDLIATEPLVSAPDYVEIVHADTLAIVAECTGPLRIILAAQCGKPRLLDNIGVHGAN